MRLRSSQFVFLLLLVCSVQGRESYGLHLMSGTAPGTVSNLQQNREVKSAVTHRHPSDVLPPTRPLLETRLDPSSIAAHTARWSMRQPAFGSAAVASFTGFLRV